MESENFYLKDFVEQRLRECVKHMKDTEMTNLYQVMLREFETPLISFVLEETGWNQSRAAVMLGLNRNTLRKKIKELGLSRSEGSSV